MTDAEKQMKRYTHGVERHLNLPNDVKARVMSDFISSIQARREAGMSDAEIFAELGTPREAAAELNTQMKEYAYRKSPWRFLFAAAALYGAWELAGSVLAWLLYLMLARPLSTASSVGIIGGADGPTAIFVTTAVPGVYHVLLPVVMLVLGVLGYQRLKKCKSRK